VKIGDVKKKKKKQRKWLRGYEWVMEVGNFLFLFFETGIFRLKGLLRV